MKKTLLFYLFTFSFLFSFSKGAGGTYRIEGTAFSEYKTVLKDVALLVTVGEKKYVVRTDSSGHFEIEIGWSTACPSVVKFSKRRKVNNKINPKYIFISCETDEKKLKNKWRKYRNSSYHKDFYFSM